MSHLLRKISVRGPSRCNAGIPSLLLIALLSASCGAGSDDRAGDRPAFETLPGGGTHVRNPSAGLWDVDSQARWRVVEHARIGRVDGDGPDVFGAVGSMAEDPLGRLWVADVLATEIRVFDRDGRFVRSVGRRGQGPEEFGRLGAILSGPDGRIWVNDATLRRWEVFDTAGVRVAGHTGNSNVGGGVRSWSPDGRLIEGIRIPGADPLESQTLYAVRHLDPTGALIPGDTFPAPVISEPERVQFTTPGDRPYTIVGHLPLAHNATYFLGPDGDLWVTEGRGAYVIRRQRLEGDTLLVVEREYEPVPVSQLALQKAREQLRPPDNMVSNDNDPDRLATVYPPFNAAYASTDSTLWVRRDLEGDVTALEVFAADGIYLGRAEVSTDIAPLSIRLVTHDRLYAVDTDDLGVQYLVFFRIERPGTYPGN